MSSVACTALMRDDTIDDRALCTHKQFHVVRRTFSVQSCAAPIATVAIIARTSNPRASIFDVFRNKLQKSIMPGLYLTLPYLTLAYHRGGPHPEAQWQVVTPAQR